MNLCVKNVKSIKIIYIFHFYVNTFWIILSVYLVILLYGYVLFVMEKDILKNIKSWPNLHNLASLAPAVSIFAHFCQPARAQSRKSVCQMQMLGLPCHYGYSIQSKYPNKISNSRQRSLIHLYFSFHGPHSFTTRPG